MDNKLKVINYLGKNTDQAFTMHELSKLAKIPYATFHRTIKKLADLIVRTKAGKATLIQINKQNQIVKHYLIISSKEEKDEYLKKQSILKKITEELPAGEYSLILFGSYSKNTQTAKSDIDLLIINKTGEREPDFSRYETLFRIRINPIYVTRKEFTAMLKDSEENIGTQALRNHILLHDPELFWNLVYGIR
ncbi:nucleotidyltransferase domain-containing protein [Candidatus Woesearchaeota archaeon]|nr:nucleotidyltransferase domain-containing protein [Candidatus Woesearchaeota archaeon]